MTTSVSNNSYLPNTDPFFQNLGVPDTLMPGFDDALSGDLIGNPISAFSDDTFACNEYEKSTTWCQEYEAALSKGDGNAAVHLIIKGLKEGIISKDDAIKLAKEVQEEANAAGGGRINKEMRNALKDALGTETEYISKGKTRPQMGFESFLKNILKFLGF